MLELTRKVLVNEQDTHVRYCAVCACVKGDRAMFTASVWWVFHINASVHK